MADEGFAFDFRGRSSGVRRNPRLNGHIIVPRPLRWQHDHPFRSVARALAEASRSPQNLPLFAPLVAS